MALLGALADDVGSDGRIPCDHTTELWEKPLRGGNARKDARYNLERQPTARHWLLNDCNENDRYFVAGGTFSSPRVPPISRSEFWQSSSTPGLTRSLAVVTYHDYHQTGTNNVASCHYGIRPHAASSTSFPTPHHHSQLHAPQFFVFGAAYLGVGPALYHKTPSTAGQTPRLHCTASHVRHLQLLRPLEHRPRR